MNSYLEKCGGQNVLAFCSLTDIIEIERPNTSSIPPLDKGNHVQYQVEEDQIKYQWVH